MLLAHIHILLASATTLSPGGTPVTLPGSSLLRGLATDVMGVIAIVCVLGLLGSAGAMSIGHHSSNGRLADKGRTGVIWSIIGAVVCGGAWAIISFAFAAGGKIH